MTDIAGAFEERDEAYEKAVSRQPAGPAPEVTAPDLLNFQEIRGSHTDKNLGDLFFRTYRHLFCNGDGQLYMFLKNTGRWIRSDLQTHVFSHSMHVSGIFHTELNAVTAERDATDNEEHRNRLSQRMAGITKLILHTEKANVISNVARMAYAKLKTILEAEPIKMNRDPELLNCRNGVVDLKTGTLRWAEQTDYLTHNTGVDYVAKTERELSWWVEKVLQMCGGNERLAEYLQVWFGYCATGYIREHCMSVMYGSGRNGKNVLMDATASALGSYACALTASFLEAQGRLESEGNNMIYMMAQLDGVRHAYVSETGERGKLKESAVKSMTGDKKLRARLARENFYEFDITHKFTVGTNHKPEISGTDDGVWERIRLVPMRVKFGDEDEVDAGVAQYLKDVTLLSQIQEMDKKEVVLAWVVAGAKKYLEFGLKQYTPGEVSAETKLYRREQDTLGQFLQYVSTYVTPNEVDRVVERVARANNKQLGLMTEAELLRVDKQELWRTYSVWAADNGHGVMSSTMFARRITSAQRFWPGDGSGEQVMKPLEAIRVNGGARYVYYRWSSPGLQLREHARNLSKRTQQEDDEA